MYKIVLVVDEHFGQRVVALAQTSYVWLVQSSENDPWAKQVWGAMPQARDPLLCGLSTFVREVNEEPDALVARLLDMIDEHHGEFAHEPPWSEIEVLGASSSAQIESATRAYGVSHIEARPGGFRMTRDSGST